MASKQDKVETAADTETPTSSKSSVAEVDKDAKPVDEDEQRKQAEAEIAKQKEQQEDDELANIATAEEYLQRKDVQLLEYEKRMFVDLVNADALTICAKGIHYDKVLLHILKVYSDTANLVLVINSSDWEERYYKSKLPSKYVHEVANTVTERERVYLEGGIQFISTRILVVDLLKQRLPIQLITGVVVLRAHTIIESCQEAFALRLYRQRNKTGFIKAFSSSAEAFMIGYGHIERTMRNLFVKELFIWPRFHADVHAALKPHEAHAVELHVPLTPKMKLIETHLLDLMNYLVREIKRINRFVDMEEITVENCITKKFHKILQAQLDCIWHQLNSQTKLIVADLKILRSLMISTIYNDAVSAYALMKRYRTTEYVMSNSGWTLLDSAEQIFKYSKERVYNAQGDFEPEHCPKWNYLFEILRIEIPADMKRTKPDCVEPPKVLILCQDKRTCYQLRQLLMQGGERFLLYTAMQQQIPIGRLGPNFARVKNAKELEMRWSQRLSQCDSVSSSQAKTKNTAPAEGVDELTQILNSHDGIDDLEAQDLLESYMLTMTQTQLDEVDACARDSQENSGKKETAEEVDASTFEPFPELDNLDISAAIAARKQPVICIQTCKTIDEGAMALERVLNELQPHYVIMYNNDVTAIRQLEVYEARLCRPAKERLKVFFLIHARTVEEQAHLTSLRRERQAFEKLIETWSKMVVPEYQDGKTDEAFVFYRSFKDHDADLEAANAASRKAGGQVAPPSSAEAAAAVPKIIVDMREFRSDLPCLLHKRGIEVLPVTITIGDYILTPEICVERKSISDLIGSLNSGRLYNQCIQMQRYYAKPILLIEFDQNKPFHLQGKYMLSQNTTGTNADITQKLQLLTLHFPKLRLIWSPSPYATAQLFEELKLGKAEPDAKQAAVLGSDEMGGGAYDELKFNANIYDFLLRLPGLNTRNVHKLMRHGGNLKELLKKTQAELSELLDSQANGKLLWDILHVAHLPEKDEVSGTAAMLAANKQFGSHSRFRRGAAASLAARGGGLRGKFK